jgi:trehalose 6-phosphate phosphatase
MREASLVRSGAPAGKAPPDAALAKTVAAAVEVLSARPAGLVTDLDGTLSPIVATPEEAFILPDCRTALRRLARRLDLVAIVSGRSADEVRRIVGLRKLVYVGNHGLDRWEGGRQRGRAAARAWRAALTAVMSELRKELSGLPGVRIEDKGVSFSVHYRGAPNHGAAQAAVVAAVQRATAPYRLSVREAKKVIEVGPPTWPGKAEVVLEMAGRFRLRSLIYMGDDRPDLEVLQRLSELGVDGVKTLAVAVDGPEAPPELREAADLTLSGPDEVSHFLGGLEEGLRTVGNGRSTENLLSLTV